jgi:hypothetical protein
MWYRFDDCNIYESTFQDLFLTYGDSLIHAVSATTGYILMYRQMVETDKIPKPDKSLISTDLMALIDEENVKILEEEAKQKERMSTLQLKFIYEDKIISIFEKKYNTIKQLKQKVMKEVNIVTDEKNVRIRNVQNQTCKPQEVYQYEEKTLEEYSFLSNKTYTIEVKKDNEQFEEYNPNMIVIFICRWVDEYNSDSFDERNFKFEKFKIDRKTSMNDFKKMLKKYYNTDEDVYLIKKNDCGINNFTINELSKPEDDLKEIHSNMIIENTKLYLEFFKQSKDSNFIKFFEERCGKVTVRFNTPIKQDKKVKITINSYQFTNEIEVKKSKTLREIKSLIAGVININEQEFILKKSSHHGAEFKNLNDTVDKYTVNAINIYVEYGCPQRESEIKINLYTCEYDYAFFLVFPYKLVDMGFFIIDTTWTIAQLKTHLVKELEKKGITKDVNKAIVREYVTERPGKVYKYLYRFIMIITVSRIIISQRIRR